jgi:hypothetical protein
MTRTLRRAAETKELARKHSRLAPHRRIRSLQAMPRNVFNHIPYRLQNPCVYRKPKRGRSDDEVRRVSRVN